jgi:hypothetical protein
MMFVPHRKHTNGTPWPVKGIALLLSLRFVNITSFPDIYIIHKGITQGCVKSEVRMIWNEAVVVKV